MEAFQLRWVSHSVDLEKAGDFAFVPKREPIRGVTRTPIDPPTVFCESILWSFFGKKYVEKETTLPLWPEYDAIILICPHCNQLIGTTKEHHIISTEPFTIEQALACAYSKPSPTALPSIAFKVTNGRIMPA
jgi:hypothetical protein